jgi:hypothetical protein
MSPTKTRNRKKSSPVTVIPRDETVYVEVKPAEPEGGMDVPLFCQKELLAIIGTADPTRQAAPYEDKNFEVWGVAVASTYPDVKRLDVQFEMHTDGYWKKDPNVTKRLAETTVPIYMHDHYEEIPNSIKYPVDIVTKYRRYFTNSIAYMQALAFHSFIMTGKPKHVAMFGVHMESSEEYTEQRPCCEYWLGRMEGAGMDIELAPGGALLASVGLYGYENYNPVCWELRQRIFGLQNGVKQSEAEVKKWELQKAKNEGAINEDEMILRKFQRGEWK